jgi:hypothetical protein
VPEPEPVEAPPDPVEVPPPLEAMGAAAALPLGLPAAPVTFNVADWALVPSDAVIV